MGVEIERKFLIDHDKWEAATKPKGVFFKQGYIVNEPGKTIRIRVAGEKAYLTIKGISAGISRLEYEYEVPVNEANELLENFASSWIEKQRYCITNAGKVWEVDVFSGDNHGLLVAEIELENEGEAFELPEWVGAEVTGDVKYYNSSLSVHPFSKWV